jgi:hypothetical protein
MKEENKMGPVEVFAGTYMQAEMVKSLLENAGIDVFLNDEINGTLIPWVVSPGGVNPVRVIVSNNDYVRAKSVVDKYEENARTTD